MASALLDAKSTAVSSALCRRGETFSLVTEHRELCLCTTGVLHKLVQNVPGTGQGAAIPAGLPRGELPKKGQK